MTVRTDRQESILVVTLDRPERRNAVDAATAAALASAFRSFDGDASLSLAILTGAGGTFCAGADLKALAEGEHRPVRAEGDGPMGPTRLRLGKPVIAAIEGYAVAGGLELALWCDMRVASEEAVLGVFCRRFGVPLVDLGTVRLPQIVGLGRAIDLVLTGRPVKAQEAWGMGLVNRVGSPRVRRSAPRWSSPGSSPPSPRPACATTGGRCSSRWSWMPGRPWRTRCAGVRRRSRPARRPPGLRVSRVERAGTASRAHAASVESSPTKISRRSSPICGPSPP